MKDWEVSDLLTHYVETEDVVWILGFLCCCCRFLAWFPIVS